MTQNVVSRLLIIGNGFDLNCGLKSSFEDYYDNEIKMVEILKKMNSNFNDRNTDTNFLKSDILRSAGFQGIYGNLHDNIDINFNDEGISFWDFYFYSHKEKLNNWSDVEYFLNNLLTINNDNEHLEFDLENSLDIVNRLKYLKPRVTIKDSFLTEFKKLRDDTFTTDKETLILLFVLLNNLKYDIDKHSKKCAWRL
ncbi:AbiH family protein [Lactiplantibacillus pentosus]|uniref:AbiH family protein n=1 Tax=Lactiplantibacillus pentosus TaxID=1589 RepID=UPI0028B91DB9|nr:AbiH family protein [Lactiplantibacillus pentosus]MDT7037329.1 AbiH family protein [Lactiplantibacillus pentosus]